MKTAFKNQIIIGLLLAVISCQKDPDPLPALTQDGRGTLACRIDGEVWMPRTYTRDFKSGGTGGSIARYLSKEKTLFLGGDNQDSHTRFLFGISNYTGKTGEYIIDNLCVDLPRVENNCASIRRNQYTVNEGNFWTNKTYLGKVTIVAHKNSFVSGTFELNLQDIKTGKTMKITEGRFDMGYRTY